jgi:hypothetical protein
MILAASYSPSYSSRLTRHHNRRVLLAIVLAGVLIDIVLVTLYCTTSRCLSQSECCANHVTTLATRILVTLILVASSSPSTRRLLLAAGVSIDIVLVTLYCTTSRSHYHLRTKLTRSRRSPLSYSSRDASFWPSFSPLPSRYRPNCPRPHHHSHYRRRAHRIVCY